MPLSPVSVFGTLLAHGITRFHRGMMSGCLQNPSPSTALRGMEGDNQTASEEEPRQTGRPNSATT